MSVSSPDPSLEALQKCLTLSDLAKVLEYEPTELSYLIYKYGDDKKYTSFQIPKKDGSMRDIDAPVARIRFLQERLRAVLSRAVLERDVERHSKRPISHGARKQTSIVTNAKRHAGRRHVINFDLRDFFPSIHIGRIAGFLEKDKYFKLNSKISMIIAQIVTNNKMLPQGSPTSPLIADLVAEVLDRRLLTLCRDAGATYSRYIDDITISTNKKEIPETIGKIEGDTFVLSEIAVAQVEKSGFAINGKKTRFSHRKSRQIVTGLIVNERVNVSSEFSRTTRAMCHKVFWNEQPYLNRFWSNDTEPVTLDTIEGRLSFESYVRDPHRKRTIANKLDHPTKFEKKYRDFLIYRYLLRSNGPVFLTEGESDRIYVDAAIKRLRGGDGSYFLTENGISRRRYSLPGNRETFHELTSLGGGTSNLHHGMILIKRFLEKYKNPQPLWPTLILVDSDEAGRGFAKSAGSWFDVSYDPETHKEIFPLRPGLYVVFVPVPKQKKSATIESLIPSKLKKLELGGKKLSLDNKFDSGAFYGKVVLARHIRKDLTIDLSFFEPLVARFDAAMSMFESDVGGLVNG